MAEPAPASPTQSEAAQTNRPTQDANTASPPENKGAQDKAAVAEAIEQLRKVLPTIAETDKVLTQTVERLVREWSDPLRANQRSFQHELAYAVEDVERTTVGTLS